MPNRGDMAMEGIPTAEDCTNVAKVSEILVKERFGNEARIDRVEIKPDDDPCYPAMWIRVVVENPGKALLDTDSVRSFRRDLSPALEEKRIHALPIPGFASRAEIRGLHEHPGFPRLRNFAGEYRPVKKAAPIRTAQSRQSHLFRVSSLNRQDCSGCSDQVPSLPGWIQAYKSVELGRLRSICSNQEKMKRFSPAILEFARLHLIAMNKRLPAGYDPYASFYRYEIIKVAEMAKLVIRNFMNTPRKERFAFVTLIVYPELKKHS